MARIRLMHTCVVGFILLKHGDGVVCYSTYSNPFQVVEKRENGRLKRGKTGRRLVCVSKIVTDAQQVSSREVNCRYSVDSVFLDRD